MSPPPDVAALVLGPQGTYVAAPARRLRSAQQSALMLRGGPRRPAVACETCDWSNVDVVAELVAARAWSIADSTASPRLA